MACFGIRPIGRHGQLKSRGLHIMMTYRDGVLWALALAVVTTSRCLLGKLQGTISQLDSASSERHRTPLTAHPRPLRWSGEGARDCEVSRGSRHSGSERPATRMLTHADCLADYTPCPLADLAETRDHPWFPSSSSLASRLQSTHLVLLGVGHEGTEVLARNDTGLSDVSS